MKVAGFRDMINWYDENAEDYAKASRIYLDTNHLQTFASLLSPGSKILDVGCGGGRDTNALTELGFKVTGLDLSKGLIKVAKKDFPNIEFVEGDMLRLQFEDESFDGVWSNSSILHFETIDEVKQALSEMRRILKKSGIVHVLVKAQTGNKTAVVKDELTGHDRFFQFFTLNEMQDLLKESGFDIISAKQYSELTTQRQGRPGLKLIWCLAQKAD